MFKKINTTAGLITLLVVLIFFFFAGGRRYVLSCFKKKEKIAVPVLRQAQVKTISAETAEIVISLNRDVAELEIMISSVDYTDPVWVSKGKFNFPKKEIKAKVSGLKPDTDYQVALRVTNDSLTKSQVFWSAAIFRTKEAWVDPFVDCVIVDGFFVSQKDGKTEVFIGVDTKKGQRPLRYELRSEKKEGFWELEDEGLIYGTSVLETETKNTFFSLKVFCGQSDPIYFYGKIKKLPKKEKKKRKPTKKRSEGEKRSFVGPIFSEITLFPPLMKTCVTSPFNQLRKRDGSLYHHTGVDLRAQKPTDIYAVSGGIITRTTTGQKAKDQGGSGKGYGNLISLRIKYLSKEVTVEYCHLSRVFVRPGQKVKKGQKIGMTGNTGHSYAPHLHLQMSVQKNKRKIYIKPLSLLVDRCK